MLSALISAIASGTGTIWDKIILSRERVTLRVFLPLVFVFLFAFTLILMPFFGSVDWEILLLPNTLFLVLLMIVIAVASNVLFYQSVQRDKIHHHEMVMMVAPLITVMLAAIFFPEEFDSKVFLLALVSSLALIWAKGKKEHWLGSPATYNAFLAVVLMATESIIIRDLLYSFTPVALYGLRTLVIAVFFYAYYRPHYNQVTIKHWWMIAFSALLGVILMLGRYYAFAELGIIYTTLVAILAPVIVFFGSWEILHEKIRPRMILASIIILACVTWATVISFG